MRRVVVAFHECARRGDCAADIGSMGSAGLWHAVGGVCPDHTRAEADDRGAVPEARPDHRHDCDNLLEHSIFPVKKIFFLLNFQ